MLNEFVLIVLTLFSQISSVCLGGSVIDDGQVKGVSTVFQGESFIKNNIFFTYTPKLVKSSNIELEAESFFVMDKKTKYIIAKKEQEKRMPIASLTKIMTALIILEENELEDTITISENALSTFGSKRGLAVGEKIRLENLLRIMIIDSNNAAAVALAEHNSGTVEKFVEKMNKRAMDMGFENTYFINPTGLDGEDDNYNFSSSYELAFLINYTFKNKLIWDISRTREAILYSVDGKIAHEVKNTNQLLGNFGGIVGGKTGYTDKAGECLAMIVQTPDGSGYVIAVILNANDRFTEMRKLLNWTFDSYSWN